jgi:hypothetical protein
MIADVLDVGSRPLFEAARDPKARRIARHKIPLIGLAMLAQDKRSGCEGVADFLCDVHGLVDDRFIFVLGWAPRAASLDRTRRCWRSMSLFRV